MEEDSGGCECVEEGGESNGRQKDIKKIEREGSDVMCNAGLTLRPGDGGTDRETTIEAALARTTGSGGLRE